MNTSTLPAPRAWAVRNGWPQLADWSIALPDAVYDEYARAFPDPNDGGQKGSAAVNYSKARQWGIARGMCGPKGPLSANLLDAYKREVAV